MEESYLFFAWNTNRASRLPVQTHVADLSKELSEYSGAGYILRNSRKSDRVNARINPSPRQTTVMVSEFGFGIAVRSNF